MRKSNHARCKAEWLRIYGIILTQIKYELRLPELWGSNSGKLLLKMWTEGKHTPLFVETFYGT